MKITKDIKKSIVVATYTLILAFLLINISNVTSILGSAATTMTPFIIGFCIAFVLNIIIKFLEENVYFFIDKTKAKNPLKIKRGISITTALTLVIGAIYLFIAFVIPQLIDSIKVLFDSIPGYMKSLESAVTPLMQSTELLSDIWTSLLSAWKELFDFSIQLLSASLNGIISTTVNITSVAIKFFVGFIFAIYMLISKETLIMHLKKCLYAFANKAIAEKIINVAYLTNTIFSKFLAGQCIEAIIVGILCLIGMLAMSMPYPLLISVIIGVTNILPIVGPFVGAIPATFIIFMVDPSQAFWFVVFIIILQQVESNLIYPRVVGNSIGLSALWVLLAILIGGSIGGPIGMLLGVPGIAVIYKLVSSDINSRLAQKKLCVCENNIIDTITEEEVTEDN